MHAQNGYAFLHPRHNAAASEPKPTPLIKPWVSDAVSDNLDHETKALPFAIDRTMATFLMERQTQETSFSQLFSCACLRSPTLFAGPTTSHSHTMKRSMIAMRPAPITVTLLF